jgi:hypothetical protein
MLLESSRARVLPSLTAVLLGALGVSMSASAQTGVVGPPAVDDPLLRDYVNANGTFHPTQLGVGNLQQLNFVADPALPTGVYHATLTVSANPNNPQAGGGDVWCGLYDVNADTFTPLTDVDAVNTTLYEFGLMYNPSAGSSNSATFGPATVAVWDDSVLVRCTYRTAFGQPFLPHQAITNAPAGFIDPTLATIGGALHLLYVGSGAGGQTIWADRLNITQGNPPSFSLALSPRMLVDAAAVTAAGFSGTPHSPTPIVGGDGNLQALVFCANAPSGDSDTYWISAVDATGKVFLIDDSPGWSNNGGVIGGRVFQANAVSIYHAFEFECAYLSGDDERASRGNASRTAVIDVHVPPDPSFPWAALLLIDGALIPGGPLIDPFAPLISGDLAVQWSGVIPAFSMPPIDPSTGRSGISAAVPANLTGNVFVQAIVLHALPSGIQGWLTNDIVVRL